MASLMRTAGSEKGKIYNPKPEPKNAAAVAEKSTEKKDVRPAENDDDDWGAVPAFLRRSRLK